MLKGNNVNKVRTCAFQVPDFVLNKKADRKMPYAENCEGVVLFADVSGYTVMCQRYASDGVRNVSDLASEFNKYLKPVVEAVLRAGGDIYKFAGDAILALWPYNSTSTKKSELITRVLDCALYLKIRYCDYTTDIGTKLHIKSAISQGSYTLFFLSGKIADMEIEKKENLEDDDESYTYTNYYMCYGPAIKRVNRCEHYCGQEDVVMDMSTWSLIEEQAQYMTENIIDAEDTYIKILSSKDLFLIQNFIRKATYYRDISAKYITKEQFNFYKSFLIEPVVRKIIQNEPIEFLSELRIVNIVFLQLEIEEKEDLPAQLQSIVTLILKEIYSTNGLLTKMLMFDKGLSFLCAFGLPGHKHGDDAERALKFAYIIVQLLKRNTAVLTCSAGVCTGMLFCGLVGHPQRYEYTVIGRKVNMSARLMMAYPNIVSCDADTFYKSRIDVSYFTELPYKELKGLQNTGIIRRYVGEQKAYPVKKDLLSEAMNLFPIIDREHEFEVFKNLVEMELRKETDHLNFFAIIGERGSGKSRLIQHMLEYSVSHWSKRSYISAVFAGLENINRKFWTIQEICEDLFNLRRRTEANKHALLISLLTRRRPHLHLLNEFLSTNFAVHPLPSNVIPNAELNSMFVEIISNLTRRDRLSSSGIIPLPILILIDDLHYVDIDSLNVLLQLADRKGIMIAFTSNGNEDEIEDARLRRIIKSERTYVIYMGKLSSKFEPTLACQLLFAGRVHHRIVSILQDRSNGFPAMVVNILSDLLVSGCIQVKDTTTVDDDKFLEGMKEYLELRIFKKDGSIEVSKDQRHLKKVITIVPGKEDELMTSLYSVHQNVHLIYDRLSDLAQRILKVASLIGLKFTVGALKAGLQQPDDDSFRVEIVNLCSCNFLMCAHVRRSLLHKYGGKRINMTCNCPTNPGKSVDKCTVMKFYTLAAKETAFSYIVTEFRINTSMKLIEYFEKQDYTCPSSCGGDVSTSTITPQKPVQDQCLLDLFYEKQMKDLKSDVKRLTRTVEKSKIAFAMTKHAAQNKSKKYRLSAHKIDELNYELNRFEFFQSGASDKKITLDFSSDMAYPSPRCLFISFPSMKNEVINTDSFEVAYNCQECRCNFMILKAYKLLIKLSNFAHAYDRLLYYTIEASRLCIDINSLFEAQVMLLGIEESIPQRYLTHGVRSFVCYLLSQIKFKIKEYTKALNYAEDGLKYLQQYVSTASKTCKLIKDYKRADSWLQALLLKSRAEVLYALNANDEAYCTILTAKHMCVNNPDVIEIHTLLFQIAYRLQHVKSAEIYFNDATGNMKRFRAVCGQEPRTFQIFYNRMICEFAQGNIVTAIANGRDLLVQLRNINASETSIMPVATILMIAAILTCDYELINELLQLFHESTDVIWYCVIGIDIINTFGLTPLSNIEQYAILINAMIQRLLATAVGTARNIRGKCLFIYMSSVLMEAFALNGSLQIASAYYNKGVVEIQKNLTWPLIYAYSFVKFALFQVKYQFYTRNNDELLIFEFIRSFKNNFPVFQPIVLICYAWCDLHLGKLKNAKKHLTMAIDLCRANDMKIYAKICRKMILELAL